MKNINKKIPRNFWLIPLFSIVILLTTSVYANLDKNFRENFTEIIKEQTHSSIQYSLDDISGFKLEKRNNDYDWKCTAGKCLEYQKKIDCLFDDAFENAVNQTNYYVNDFVKQNIAGLEKVQLRENCDEITLKNIQKIQEENGFSSKCQGKFTSRFYSSCRVSETILNELQAYENFLLAKSNDMKSFSRENFEYDDGKNNVIQNFKKIRNKFLQEMEKSKKAVTNTLILYKDFVHYYRIHAWLMAIKEKTRNLQRRWLEDQQALETFPAKFLKASSIGG